MTARSLLRFVLAFGLLSAALLGLLAIAGGTAGWTPVQAPLLLIFLGAGVGAFSIATTRTPLRSMVRHLLPGRPEVRETALMRLAQLLEGSLEPHRLLATMAKIVAQALHARYAGIYLKRLDAEDMVLVTEHQAWRDDAATPQAPSATADPLRDPSGDERGPSPSLALPLVYQSEVVGQLLVVLDEGRRLTAKERSLLVMIARRAGATAQVVRQAQDLVLARERLVLAREEERRRLRRNLHDNIGPTLAALSLKAGSVRSLIEQDPPAAHEQMNELREHIQSVITDIRRVVYDLRPPALDELGILPAIREQASLFSTGGLQVRVDAPVEMPSLPAAVEVAAYRIVMEALTNVARHSQARMCQIHFRLNDQVHIEVVDDGVGLPAQHRAGVGIASIRERVAELGGSCTIESPPEGGTRVVATLPASSRAPEWGGESAAEAALLMDDPG
ncbi:MAG TPA: GAF domain-containing sensor histidine kinase [Anaerolineales bacterium]|nr:GAF domain-containing sensor histidine kinase [Anaerolineales bacterium]